MELITTNDALSELCTELAKQRYITVDTEFLREKTFWPQVCLIQTAGQEIEAMIDPLAEGLDLAPFYKLLANENVRSRAEALLLAERLCSMGKLQLHRMTALYILVLCKI